MKNLELGGAGDKQIAVKAEEESIMIAIGTLVGLFVVIVLFLLCLFT